MAKIADVIKYEGDNSTFIWKHPSEDFNSMTQLVVHESQEAIFFMNGQALDLFGPGRYTLETQNIPKIGKLLNRTTGETPFHCEVYFINKTEQMSIKWGTDSRVRFIEQTFGVPLEIGASGEMNLMVSDARKLLIKIVGTTNGIAWGEQGSGFTKSLSASFRPLISNAVKTNLTTCIKARNVNILEVDEHLNELSETLKKPISEGFAEYGLSVAEFYVTTVLLPEDDPNFRRIRELHTISLQQRMVEAEAVIKSAQAQAEASITVAQRQAIMEKKTTETEVARREAERDLIRAQTEAQKAKLAGMAEADVMRAKGYNQKDVLQAEVQKAYAEGIGNMEISGSGGSAAGDMIGLGVGMAAAGAVNGQLGNMFKGFASFNAENENAGINAADSETKKENAICHDCGAAIPQNSKFCPECGSKVERLAENEMICPHCGSKTHKGKFCSECGMSLVSKCPKCGSELSENAKFCPECGEKIK